MQGAMQEPTSSNSRQLLLLSTWTTHKKQKTKRDNSKTKSKERLPWHTEAPTCNTEGTPNPLVGKQLYIYALGSDCRLASAQSDHTGSMDGFIPCDGLTTDCGPWDRPMLLSCCGDAQSGTRLLSLAHDRWSTSTPNM